MNCGSRDFLCYLLGLLANHGADLSKLAEFIPLVRDFVVNYAQAIIGLLGLSFGIWKWWRFHDRVLHKRLRSYLNLQEHRLTEARSYVTEALNRPGPERRFAEPLFAVRPLRRILGRRNWEPIFRLTKLETSAERHLDKALRKIDNRLTAAEDQMRTLRLQKASAFLLKGAIASARAGSARDEKDAVKLDYRSLDSFRAALQVPDFEADVELLEFEAHQLLRLGYLSEAEARFEAMGDKVAKVSDQRKRNLLQARLNRYLAVIAQAQAVRNFQAGRANTDGSANAHELLCQNNAAMTALQLRAPHAPYQGWDALDQADLHYLSAFVCHKRGFNQQATSQLTQAETEYRRILDGTATRRWLLLPLNRRLNAAALKGLERTKIARANASYDEAWLLPPSQPPERPTSDIGQSSSSNRVEGAA